MTFEPDQRPPRRHPHGGQDLDRVGPFWGLSRATTAAGGVAPSGRRRAALAIVVVALVLYYPVAR